MIVRVLKFGGTSVADAERIAAAAAIVDGAREGAEAPVVVVSALAGVTDLLERALERVHRADREALERVLADVERRHRWAIAHGIGDASRRHHLNLEVDAGFEALRGTLRSIRQLGETTARARDAVLATGESLSGPIVRAALEERGVAADWIDPRTWLVTNDAHGTAEALSGPTRDAARRRFAEVLDAGRVPVTGGFVGATADGETTTLGRGGSDTSAAFLAASLDARRLEIWTDVDGLMSADPRLVPEARPLPAVGYEEAAALAHYGARVLHPACLAPVGAAGIPVEVRNTGAPDRTGTRIAADGTPADGIVAVASRERVVSLRLRHRGMRADPAFLPGVLERCRSAGVAADLMAAGEASLQLVLPEGPHTARAIEALGSLPGGCETEATEEGALVAVIGSALHERADCRSAVMAAVARWEPALVLFGAARSSLLAVLPRASLGDAVRELHGRFFQGVDV